MGGRKTRLDTSPSWGEVGLSSMGKPSNKGRESSTEGTEEESIRRENQTDPKGECSVHLWQHSVPYGGLDGQWRRNQQNSMNGYAVIYNPRKKGSITSGSLHIRREIKGRRRGG